MKTTYYVGASADGFIAKKDGDVSWLEESGVPLEETGYEEFYATVDALVMGRKTYEMIVSFGEASYGDKPVWICTNGQIKAMGGCNLQPNLSPEDIVKSAQDMGIKHLWLVGGGSLASSYLEKSLLTNISVTQIPIILGEGIPLFGTINGSKLLKLESTQTISSELIQINYSVVNS